MVRIRLRRVGAKKQASFCIVVADSRSPRDGRFIESIGFYNPRTEPETVKYDEERALYWLSVGAQPSEAVARMLETGGTLARAERLKAGEPMEALLAEAAAEAQPTTAPEIEAEPVAQQVEEEVLEETAEEEPEVNVEAPDQGAEEADS
jgi:small subunit ribosomal protein S16